MAYEIVESGDGFVVLANRRPVLSFKTRADAAKLLSEVFDETRVVKFKAPSKT